MKTMETDYSNPKLVTMKKFMNYSFSNVYIICVMFFLVLFTSCEPKHPESLTFYNAEQLKYHPKDENGVPIGYQIIYSRTGINSIDYVKTVDIEKFNEELKFYEDYQKQKVLENEYGKGDSPKWYQKQWVWYIVIMAIVFIYNMIKGN